MSQKSSLYRVIEILKRLNNGEKLCVSRLVAEYEVSERTIQRDFKMIIEVFDDFLIKEGECYRGYKKVLLDELLQGTNLMMLSNIVNIFHITDSGLPISKETKLLIKNSMNIYTFKSRPIEKAYNKSIIKVMEHGIKFNKELNILYHGRYLKNQSLQIQPYKLVFSVDNLYLIAYSPKENKIRKFRVSNIEHIELTTNSFYKKKKIELYINSMQTLLANDESRDIFVKLRANSAMAKYFQHKQYLASQRITKHFENGDIIVEFDINNFKEIEEFIIKWLPNIKILEPEDLNNFIKENLSNKLNLLNKALFSGKRK